MSSNNFNENHSKEYLTQILYLNGKNKENVIKNNSKDFEFSFKLNKMSYLDTKNRKFITFGFGKITFSSNPDINLINISFHDSSLQLRFQGFISIKLSSFNLDINKKYCIKINKIIANIFHMNNPERSKIETILTEIYLSFEREDDINQLLDNLNHI